MTPEFHRDEARRCRIAAERSDRDSAKDFMDQAQVHDLIADILIELGKINARVPRRRSAPPRPRGQLH